MLKFAAAGIDVIRACNAHVAIVPNWVEGKDIIVTWPDGVEVEASIEGDSLVITELPHPEGDAIGRISGGSSMIRAELPVGSPYPLVVRQHSS